MCKSDADARGVAPAPPTDAELDAIRARADVIRPLLKSISAWPWKSVKVDEEGWPCIPHPHFDFYQEVQVAQVIEERSGYLHARADATTPTTGHNVGCYLGKESDADFIIVAPQVIRSLRDDVWALLSALSAVRERAQKAEAELRVTETLLTERQKVLDAIPECPSHGACVPHALEWIEAAKRRAQV